MVEYISERMALLSALVEHHNFALRAFSGTIRAFCYHK